MDQAEYDSFWQALVSAEVSEMHEFESIRLFEGCMPVEEPLPGATLFASAP